MQGWVEVGRSVTEYQSLTGAFNLFAKDRTSSIVYYLLMDYYRMITNGWRRSTNQKRPLVYPYFDIST